MIVLICDKLRGCCVSELLVKFVCTYVQHQQTTKNKRRVVLSSVCLLLEVPGTVVWCERAPVLQHHSSLQCSSKTRCTPPYPLDAAQQRRVAIRSVTGVWPMLVVGIRDVNRLFPMRFDF